jgi:pimeloyl-ACP methyl ester carboxylesterase
MRLDRPWRRLFFFAVAAFLTAQLTTAALAQACTTPDNVTRVSGNAECFAIRTVAPTTRPAAPVLVVWIHGDVSAGGPADYMDEYLPVYATPDVVQVRMLRPGYEDSAVPPNVSSGTTFTPRGSSWTPDYIDAAANAIAALRNFHSARYVVVVGHSGGAIYSSVILGRQPGVIDASLLVSTPGDLCVWRAPAPCTFVRTVLNPIDFIGTIPSSARLIALVGSDDTNTRPPFVQDYVTRASAVGVNISYVEIAGGQHGFGTVARNQPQFATALRSLIAAAPALPAPAVPTLPWQALLLLFVVIALATRRFNGTRKAVGATLVAICFAEGKEIEGDRRQGRSYKPRVPRCAHRGYGSVIPQRLTK